MAENEADEEQIPLRRRLSDPLTRKKEQTKGFLANARLKIVEVWRWLRPRLPHISAYLTALLGWSALSIGLYLIIDHYSVLFFSAGLLFLSGLGWRTVAELVWDGIYVKWLRDQQEQQETQG